MSNHIDSNPQSQVNNPQDSLKWYYAYLIDDIPQQMPADNAMGYTGPFDTEREAWLSLHGEMAAYISDLEKYFYQLRGSIVETGYISPIPNKGGAK